MSWKANLSIVCLAAGIALFPVGWMVHVFLWTLAVIFILLGLLLFVASYRDNRDDEIREYSLYHGKRDGGIGTVIDHGHNAWIHDKQTEDSECFNTVDGTGDGGSGD